MTNYPSILNKGQEEAKAEILSWFADPNQEYFFLSGQAGTGKTFLITDILDTLPASTIVALTATTNKAATNLSLTTGRKAKTIHSLLGLTIQNDFNTGKQRLKASRNSTTVNDALIIIDEASMIDAYLFSFIKRYTYNCKILFVGDKYQLPPVGSNQLLMDELAMPSIHLEEIMRANKKPDLEAAYALSRDVVVNQTDIVLPAESQNVMFLENEEKKKVLTEVLTENPHGTRILCYTNQAVQQCNTLARKILNLPPEPVVGDTLICESAYIVNGKVIASIGQEIEVEEIDHTFDEIEGVMYPISIIQSAGYRYAMFTNPMDRAAVIKSYAKAKDWANYFKYSEVFVDLRHSHATTVHKAQGSTYSNVFLMLNDIDKCRKHEERRRIYYVGVTRASNSLYLVK